MVCPLCYNEKTEALGLFEFRAFHFCGACKLIFVPAPYRLTAEEEKKRYLLHHNSITDKKYIAFLEQAIDPTMKFVDANMVGLDYGCGPSPVLASLLESKKIACQYYDPFFFPKLEGRIFDFIISTECVEHFYYPRKTFDHIDQLLKKGGYLTIMTSFWDSLAGFPAWYYKNDPAHVAFYHIETWAYFAEHYHYDLLYSDRKKVVILRKR